MVGSGAVVGTHVAFVSSTKCGGSVEGGRPQIPHSLTPAWWQYACASKYLQGCGEVVRW